MCIIGLYRWPDFFVNVHNRALELESAGSATCSSTLLAQVKNVPGRELRICIVFHSEGRRPIIGSLRTVIFTLFYMQGKEWEVSPEYLCCCCTSYHSDTTDTRDTSDTSDTATAGESTGRRPHPIPLHAVERDGVRLLPLQRDGEISPAVADTNDTNLIEDTPGSR